MSTQLQRATPANRNDAAGFPFLVQWGLIVILAVLAVGAMHAPEPKPATAPQDDFSAERAMAHVREIARVPHTVGSPAGHQVRDYLTAKLTELGFAPQVFSGIGVDPTAQLVIAGRTDDIFGRLAGVAGGPAIMLMTHYDSVNRDPGAADVVVLASCRASSSCKKAFTASAIVVLRTASGGD